MYLSMQRKMMLRYKNDYLSHEIHNMKQRTRKGCDKKSLGKLFINLRIRRNSSLKLTEWKSA